MTSFPKCIRCGYDPNPMYERAIAAADKWLEDTKEERDRKFWENLKIWEEKESSRMPPAFEAGES